MTFEIEPFIVLSSLKMKKAVTCTARIKKKAVGSFGLPTARWFTCGQALWADPPKEAEKAKKGESAAHVEVPVHRLPLDDSFYPIATGPVNTFFCDSSRVALHMAFQARFLLAWIV
ncbi:MAG: hypothetical protein HPY67_01115 [Syntrophaceae bacterium]|nr:hypothetical protein [Syntrophaceae bacterium]